MPPREFAIDAITPDARRTATRLPSPSSGRKGRRRRRILHASSGQSRRVARSLVRRHYAPSRDGCNRRLGAPAGFRRASSGAGRGWPPASISGSPSGRARTARRGRNPPSSTAIRAEAPEWGFLEHRRPRGTKRRIAVMRPERVLSVPTTVTSMVFAPGRIHRVTSRPRSRHYEAGRLSVDSHACDAAEPAPNWTRYSPLFAGTWNVSVYATPWL